jgi:hypothetical protein
MNLVDLIVLVCSVANPGACREQHLVLDIQGSLNTCMMQAQPYLAQWAGEHPDLRIKRWRCEWPDREGKDI